MPMKRYDNVLKVLFYFLKIKQNHIDIYRYEAYNDDIEPFKELKNK